MVVVWVVEGRLSPRIALLVTLFDTMERGITVLVLGVGGNDG